MLPPTSLSLSQIGDTPGSGKVYCNHCAFVLKSADPYLQNGDRFYHCPYPECDYDVCADCAKMPVRFFDFEVFYLMRVINLSKSTMKVEESIGEEIRMFFGDK